MLEILDLCIENGFLYTQCVFPLKKIFISQNKQLSARKETQEFIRVRAGNGNSKTPQDKKDHAKVWMPLILLQ